MTRTPSIRKAWRNNGDAQTSPRQSKCDRTLRWNSTLLEICEAERASNHEQPTGEAAREKTKNATEVDGSFAQSTAWLQLDAEAGVAAAIAINSLSTCCNRRIRGKGIATTADQTGR